MSIVELNGDDAVEDAQRMIAQIDAEKRRRNAYGEVTIVIRYREGYPAELEVTDKTVARFKRKSK